MSEANDSRRASTLIDQQKKWLVEQGDRIGELAGRNRDWKHQIRSLWEAARTENEPLALLNLLRYQAARNRSWSKPRDVFEPLSTAIEDCVTTAGEDSARAMDLIRHLLAYTYRSYTFHHEPRQGATS